MNLSQDGVTFARLLDISLSNVEGKNERMRWMPVNRNAGEDAQKPEVIQGPLGVNGNAGNDRTDIVGTPGQVEQQSQNQQGSSGDKRNAGKSGSDVWKHAQTVTPNSRVVVSSLTINVTGFSTVNKDFIRRGKERSNANIEGTSYFQNIRGLNKSSKQMVVKQLVCDYKLSFIALLETKIAGDKMQRIATKMIKNWDWISKSQQAVKGRIWILWDSDIVTVQCITSSEQCMTCKIKSKDDKISCLISVVYAFNDMEGMKVLWDDILSFKQSVNCPWIVGGDFNAIISAEEKLGGALDAISRIWSRLDRILVNEDWIQNYNSSQVDFLAPICSDHSPALLIIGDEVVEGKRPFRFFNMWVNHPEFIPVVRNAWRQNIRGYYMYKLHAKLKNLKQDLKELNKKHFMNISEQVSRANSELSDIQNHLNNDLFNQDLIRKEKEFLDKYTKLLDCETSFYRQKANIKWGLYGDKCSKKNFSIMKAKRNQNRVLSLYAENGDRITDFYDIITEFTGYYENLLGIATPTITHDPGVISNGPVLSPAQSNMLCSPVTRAEIRQAVFSISNDKAPGPD
ncbi:uncharacterized protein LOC109842140 [Asparagus officinalis]|uniref:uncharacterized protein LOC109842140 n=1 Tax=Asparagus officinalis TaxID=4686 RepID=UPI00098DF34F|nr:uncharacterized protein LOC109842140 [Asparagus officinalis]